MKIFRFYAAYAILAGKDLYTNMTPVMISSLAIIVFAALIHASFQLSISVLTLLSGHAIGKKTAYKRVLRRMGGFTAGVLLLTCLILSAVSYYFALFINHIDSAEQYIAAICCDLMIALGVAIWVFYYRRGRGTALWIPRSFADYLAKRTKKTKNSAESFALGMASVAAETIFIIGPVIAASLAIITLPDFMMQIAGVGLYVTVSILPLAVMVALVGAGRNIASLQQWRESHKRFLQFASGGSESFALSGGVAGFVQYMNRKKMPLHEKIFYAFGEKDGMSVECAMQWNDSYQESVQCFTNAD